MGRVLCGGPALWPPDNDVGLLNVWPGHRRLAGLRLQSLANLGGTRNMLVSLAPTALVAPAWDDSARDFARNFARYFARDFARGLFKDDAEAQDAVWLPDFALGETFSSGRVMLPAILAHAERVPETAAARLMRAACRVYYGLEEPDALGTALEHYGRGIPPKGELWLALARHIAGCGSPEDTALLDRLARCPDEVEPPLQWGLKYIVRGDVMLEDGTEIQLEDLAAEVGLESALPYIDPMPERFEVDWEEEAE